MPELIVFDTNVVISALLSNGAAHHCFTLARSRTIQAVYCPEILAELSEKLQFKLKYSVDDIRAIVYMLRSFSLHVNITGKLQVVHKDPDDDKFIECALISGSKIILSSDHHLLNLGGYQDIQIIQPRDFLNSRRGIPRL